MAKEHADLEVWERYFKWEAVTVEALTPSTKMCLPPHSHVGIEFYYVVSGELHEIRLNTAPPSQAGDFPAWAERQSPPNLSNLTASDFEKNVLKAGFYNTNEIGSVHQTYTDVLPCVLVLACGWVFLSSIVFKLEPLLTLFHFWIFNYLFSCFVIAKLFHCWMKGCLKDLHSFRGGRICHVNNGR